MEIDLMQNATAWVSDKAGCITFEACKTRCQEECLPSLINSFVSNNLSLLAYAVVVLILFIICNNNFDDLLKKIQSVPQTANYTPERLRLFLNAIFLLGLLLIALYVILLKLNIR